MPTVARPRTRIEATGIGRLVVGPGGAGRWG